MTTQEKLIKNKLGLLELTTYLRNVSEACRVVGFSRDTFYRVKKGYEEGAFEKLKEKGQRKPNAKNRVPEEVEQEVLKLVLKESSPGRKRVSDYLRQKGFLRPWTTLLKTSFRIWASELGSLRNCSGTELSENT
jgi:hypothetical protein